jgi:hypothetical protein
MISFSLIIFVNCESKFSEILADRFQKSSRTSQYNLRQLQIKSLEKSAFLVRSGRLTRRLENLRVAELRDPIC